MLAPPPPPPPPLNDARAHTTAELMAVVSSPLNAESDIAFLATDFAGCVHNAMARGWVPQDWITRDLVHLMQGFNGPWAVAEWDGDTLWDDIARECGYTAHDLYGFTVFLQKVVADMSSIRLQKGIPNCDALLLLTTALCLIQDGDPDGLVHYEETRKCVLVVARKTVQLFLGLSDTSGDTVAGYPLPPLSHGLQLRYIYTYTY
jgi:hypothetical protein